jgi:hypothetical protein
MPRCAAKTKSGRRCLNRPLLVGDFCAVHRDQVSIGEVASLVAGGVVGNLILPGLGGKVIGSVAGPFVRNLIREAFVVQKPVFVSFDFDHDRVLKDFIVGQARLSDSPFQVIDHSLKEAAPERNWQDHARAAIKRADLVLVMVGEYTYRAHGVLQEIEIAREEGVPIVQVIGYSDRNCPSVPNAGRLYTWNWENLKKLLS